MTLAEPIHALLAAAFAGQAVAELAPTEGGYSHQTMFATIGGRRCVVKAATSPAKRTDVRRDARVLVLLEGQRLPTPHLLALCEDADWTVAVTAALGGHSGMRLYDQPAALAAAYRELGALLAHVHRTAPAPSEPDVLLAERFRPELLAALDLEPALHSEFASSLAHPAWRPARAALVHGDAGLHNVLWDERIVGLLDWEWSGWGNPLLDLAWVYWTMRWRTVDPALWTMFIGGYQAGGAALEAANAASLRALALGQIAGILARTHGQPAARAEWLRRAEWTLALTFPNL